MKVALARCLLVGLAGSAGALARYFVGLGFAAFALTFPLGTLVINLTGSMFLGWFLAQRDLPDTLRVTIAVGFVGAYTTFSTYMVDSNRLIQNGALADGFGNLIGSVVLGIAAVRLGAWLGRRA